jgi:hypothetical protein
MAKDKVDFVLYGAGLSGVVLVGVTSLVSLVTAIVLAIRADDLGIEIPAEFDTGIEHETAFEIVSLQWLPFVDWSVSIQEPRGMKNRFHRVGMRMKEFVTAHRRGVYDHVTRRFHIGDLFGLSSVTFEKRSEKTFRVLPAMGRGQMSLAMRMISGEGISHPEGEPVGDRVEMRRYAPGDPLRLVLWKTYARTRNLLVRTEERAIAPNPSTVGYLVAGTQDEPAASTARLFVEQDLLGEDYVFGADGSNFNADTRNEALKQIVESVEHQDNGGVGLSGFMRRQDHRRLGQCVIFAPGTKGPWLQHVIQLAGTLPRRPKVVLGIDGALEPKKKTRLRRMFTQSQVQGEADLTSLPELYDILSKHGCEVSVLHRTTGKILGPTQINSLRKFS